MNYTDNFLLLLTSRLTLILLYISFKRTYSLEGYPEFCTSLNIRELYSSSFSLTDSCCCVSLCLTKSFNCKGHRSIISNFYSIAGFSFKLILWEPLKLYFPFVFMFQIFDGIVVLYGWIVESGQTDEIPISG